MEKNKRFAQSEMKRTFSRFLFHSNLIPGKNNSLEPVELFLKNIMKGLSPVDLEELRQDEAASTFY